MQILLILLPTFLAAQPTVAPTPEPVGPRNGQNINGYNVQNSFEVGYRWRTVDGNLGKYRSDVNFGNGIRLLGSQLRVNSREGQGKYFDELVLNTQGVGADPYQFATLRLDKNRLYRYDMNWRLNEYYNPALTISFGEHFLNTSRTFQDHDFILFPQSSLKLFAGYTRNSQSGPALSTIQLFDSRGDEFPLFMDVRRQRNEFRLGGEAVMRGFTLNVLHGWDNFKEDTPYLLPTSSAGNNANDNTTLSQFRRFEPYHGNSPYWRLFLLRNGTKFSMNARFTSVSGRRNFVLDETAVGTDRLAAARNRQILVTGSARRPVTAGNLNVGFYPVSRLTITNHTAFHNTRMDGDATFREIANNAANNAVLNFQFLGIRAITNLTDATYALNKNASVYGGYHFSDRRIRSREGESFDRFTDVRTAEQTNRLHSGLAGIRLRPFKPVTLQFDAEIGRADKPFFPISEKNYHALNGRIQYRTRSLQLGAQTRTFYNTNSVSLFAHSSRSRSNSLDASWTAGSNLAIDASYAKLHLDTQTGIAFFAAGDLVENLRSIYISNLHTGHLNAHTSIRKRVDVTIGYSIVRDTGDGRRAPVFPINVSPDASEVFYWAQTFPLSFQSPRARISIPLNSRLRWNVGYQFYAYREDFFQFTYQNYRAHTGYTSLLWSF